VEKIKAFVEAYNTAVVHMNTELTERRYNARDKYGGSYAPLRAEQKKEMSEDEIKAWEEKAKSGMLRGDSILFSAYSNTRMAATDVVKRQTMPGGNGLSIDNPYTSLASIGITTTSFNKNSVEGAKLELDESKLREALTAAPDKVAELFTLEQEVLDNEGEPILDWNGNPLYDKGIAMRLYDVVNENITAISNKAGVDTSYVDTSLMAKEIGRVDEQIKNFEERMQAMSERYWKQFTRMEKLISAYTSQSEWLTQQIEQLTSNKSN
jgi:flagellar hook-associated protein 2